MKKFLMTLLVLAIAIVPLFSMVVMAYDYTNDQYFNVFMFASGGNTLLTSSPKEDSSIPYSRVKFSEKSEVNSGYVWVENESDVMLSDKVYILPDGTSRQMNYISNLNFTEGDRVRFFGEQYNVSTKEVVGRAYPY